MIHASTAAASGLRAKITRTTATLVRVSATTIEIDEVAKAAATDQPGRPMPTMARSVFDRSRQAIRINKLPQAETDRQNTVVQAWEWSSERMNSPPVLKISDDVASSSTDNGDARLPTGA